MPIDYVCEATKHRRWGEYWLRQDFNLLSESMARRRIYSSKKLAPALMEPTFVHYIESLQAFSLHIIITEIRSYD